MNESSVVLRPAVADRAEGAETDASTDACVDLWTAAVAERDGAAEDPAVSDRARQKFAAEHVAWLVATGADGAVDGFVLVTAPGTGRSTDPSDAAYLSLLAVRPGLQARGLGRSLLTAAVDAARDAGYPRVVLHVLGGNERAVRLYEVGGFVPTGEEFAHALSGSTTRVYVAG